MGSAARTASSRASVRDRQPALHRDAHFGLRSVHGQGGDQAPVARPRHSAAALRGRVADRRRPALEEALRRRSRSIGLPVHRQAGPPRQQHRGRQGGHPRRGAGVIADNLPARQPGIARTVRPEPRRIQSVRDPRRRRGPTSAIECPSAPRSCSISARNMSGGDSKIGGKKHGDSQGCCH